MTVIYHWYFDTLPYLFIVIIDLFKVQIHDQIFFAKIACPAIIYAEIVVVIDLFFVGVCPWIKVYRYYPTEICQQRLQGVRYVAQKLCSWEGSFKAVTKYKEGRVWTAPVQDNQGNRLSTEVRNYGCGNYLLSFVFRLLLSRIHQWCCSKLCITLFSRTIQDSFSMYFRKLYSHHLQDCCKDVWYIRGF